METFKKKQKSGTLGENKWFNELQRFTSDSEWKRVVQGVTAIGTTSGKTNDNEWKRVKTNDNEC